MSEIHVHLDQTACEPGSEVAVRVDWHAGEKRPGSVAVSLLWHTAGKGTEDIEVVRTIEVEDPPLQGSRQLTFQLPAFPWSFSGTLVSLIWAVEASLDPGGAVDLAELVLAPGGEEIRL